MLCPRIGTRTFNSLNLSNKYKKFYLDLSGNFRRRERLSYLNSVDSGLGRPIYCSTWLTPRRPLTSNTLYSSSSGQDRGLEIILVIMPAQQIVSMLRLSFLILIRLYNLRTGIIISPNMIIVTYPLVVWLTLKFREQASKCTAGTITQAINRLQ